MAIYNGNAVEELNSGLPRTNPDSDRMKDLNQGSTDFKSSALNYSATPPVVVRFASLLVVHCIMIVLPGPPCQYLLPYLA